mgnify:FL=1
MTINIPQKAEQILHILNEAGYEAYVVGGCVRDSILDRVPGDWDITTSALPEQVKELFHRTVDTGIQHGTVTVMMGKEGFEVTTYRVDGEYHDGRHPDAVTFTRSLEEDLKRRDFTINAMAYHPEHGLVDLFGGMEDIDQKIISMYAKGMTTRQISETIEDIYGFETSESFISDVTDKILPQIEDWQNRPLDEVYPILYIDAIHYSVRDNGVIRKLAAYVILGINTEGKKEVLTISVGDNESAKYWLSVMNELKNRGVKDVLIICADGLTGIKEAIAAAFPKTEYQRCIVHQVRNTLKYVPDKDRKAFATDLKTIYQATDEKKALAALERVTEKWTPKYPNSMKRWKDNWDAISPIFKFSTTVRTVIYTTNAIESLNSTYRKLNRQRSVFPSDTALLKALYLATFEATKKWTSTIRNWAQVYGELSIMYEGRLPE